MRVVRRASSDHLRRVRTSHLLRDKARQPRGAAAAADAGRRDVEAARNASLGVDESCQRDCGGGGYPSDAAETLVRVEEQDKDSEDARPGGGPLLCLVDAVFCDAADDGTCTATVQLLEQWFSSRGCESI